MGDTEINIMKQAKKATPLLASGMGKLYEKKILPAWAFGIVTSPVGIRGIIK